MHVEKETRGGLGGRFFKGIGRRLPLVLIFALIGAIAGMALSMYVIKPLYQAGFAAATGSPEAAVSFSERIVSADALSEALASAGKESTYSTEELSERVKIIPGEENVVNVTVNLPNARDAYDVAVTLAQYAGGLDVLDVSEAYYPKTISYPIAKYNAAALGAAGALLGLLLAIIGAATDGMIHRRRDVERAFTRPVIAATPDMSDYGGLYTAQSPWPVPEAFHNMIKNVNTLLPGEGSKIIGVTDAGYAEGKERMASNIAIALGEHGQRVLLMDADFDGKSVSSLLNLPKEPGLLDLMAGREQFRTTLLKDPLHGIYVLPSGNRSAGDSPVTGQKMTMLLQLLRKHFDYIVISLPEAEEVYNLIENESVIDGILLIIYNGSSTFKEVKKALAELSFVRDRILGFIYDEAEEDDIVYDAEIDALPVEV